RSFKDSEGMYVNPLRWYLDKGKHTIRLQTQESIAIDQIVISSPQSIPQYTDYLAGLPGERNGSGEIIQIEAEIMNSKNDVSLQMAVDQDPLVTPNANGKQIFNTVGGTRWEQGGKAITWSFDVPKDGWYKIAIRAFQGYQTNKRVFRTIYIDGQIPFKELEAYPIEYASSWQGVTLQDADGGAFELYL